MLNPAPTPSDIARVSVCMATFNGAQFVKEQLTSILQQLKPEDEIVIVDDASRDDTVAVIRSIQDERIRLHARDRNVGYVRTFEEAMTRATGDILILSDQDDVWVPGRRDALVAELDRGGVVASNIDLLGSEAPLPSPITRRPWRLRSHQSRWALRNELRILLGIIPYFGSAMALSRDVAAIVLPFPAFLDESHDLWIATVGNAARRMRHLEEVTLHRRLHAANASPSRPRGLGPVVRARMMLLRCWLVARRRVRRAGG